MKSRHKKRAFLRFFRAGGWLCLAGSVGGALVFLTNAGLQSFFVPSQAQYPANLHVEKGEITPFGVPITPAQTEALSDDLREKLPDFIEQVYVREGDWVEEGNVLYSLSREKIESALVQKEKQLFVLQIKWVCLVHNKNIDAIAQRFGDKEPDLMQGKTAYVIKVAQKICNRKHENPEVRALFDKIENLNKSQSFVSELLSQVQAHEAGEAGEAGQIGLPPFSRDKKANMLKLTRVYIDRSLSQTYSALHQHGVLPPEGGVESALDKKEQIAFEISKLEQDIALLRKLRENGTYRAQQAGQIFSVSADVRGGGKEVLGLSEPIEGFGVELAVLPEHLVQLRQNDLVKISLDNFQSYFNARVIAVEDITPLAGDKRGYVYAKLVFAPRNIEVLGGSAIGGKEQVRVAWGLDEQAFADRLWAIWNSGIFVAHAEAFE